MPIKNYLTKWEHGTNEELLYEVCDKLFELQIDFDQVEGNALIIMNNEINLLKEKIEKLEKKMQR